MPQILTRALYALLLLTFVSFSTGCDSGGDEDDGDDDDNQMVVDPTFSVASVGVTCDSGQACLQFFLTPSENVTITEVRVTNPVAGQERFNGNNNVALSGQPFALQNPNEAYTRVSGNWTFAINGAKTTGNRDGFTVTTSVSVGAFAPDGTTVER